MKSWAPEFMSPYCSPRWRGIAEPLDNSETALAPIQVPGVRFESMAVRGPPAQERDEPVSTVHVPSFRSRARASPRQPRSHACPQTMPRAWHSARDRPGSEAAVLFGQDDGARTAPRRTDAAARLSEPRTHTWEMTPVSPDHLFSGTQAIQACTT